MNCMKCGREVVSEQVFCDPCLEQMAKYPVDPDTPVQIPRRQAAVPKKTPKRRTVPAEEQLKVLKSRFRLAVIFMILGWVLALVLAYPAFMHFMDDEFAPGQNYSSVSQDAPSDSTSD